MKHLNTADITALILVIIGGVNWGLIGLFNFNLVDEVFGFSSPASKIVYALVGISAMYSIYFLIKLILLLKTDPISQINL